MKSTELVCELCNRPLSAEETTDHNGVPITTFRCYKCDPARKQEIIDFHEDMRGVIWPPLLITRQACMNGIIRWDRTKCSLCDEPACAKLTRMEGTVFLCRTHAEKQYDESVAKHIEECRMKGLVVDCDECGKSFNLAQTDPPTGDGWVDCLHCFHSCHVPSTGIHRGRPSP